MLSSRQIRPSCKRQSKKMRLGPCTELGDRIADVRADRRRADKEGLPNLAGPLATCDAGDHFALAGGQSL